MLATILHTPVAAEVSVNIMRTFVKMRKYISANLIEQDNMKNMLIKHDNEIKLLQESFSKLEEKEKAVSYGKQYVINGADGTYAVLTDQGECLNGDDGDFDDGCVEGFTYNKKDIIFSIAKINGKIVENFANDSGGTKMDLSKEEKNDINIRLTEIQTILENDLYEDRLEEQELIKERKELEHLLEVS